MRLEWFFSSRLYIYSSVALTYNQNVVITVHSCNHRSGEAKLSIPCVNISHAKFRCATQQTFVLLRMVGLLKRHRLATPAIEHISEPAILRITFASCSLLSLVSILLLWLCAHCRQLGQLCCAKPLPITGSLTLNHNITVPLCDRDQWAIRILCIPEWSLHTYIHTYKLNRKR